MGPSRSPLEAGIEGGVRSAAGVDYRLAREATLQALRAGDVSASQVCDAQRELRRNAEFCGTEVERDCPVCESEDLVELLYVFGSRLPNHGRCVTTGKELARLEARATPCTGYEVEVCVDCGWNHLIRRRELGGPEATDVVGH